MSGVRAPEDGIVLVNVLVVLAIAAGIVALMLTAQDRAIDRARQAANLAQARALTLGAEASVTVALRRDMIEAPEADHLGEPWAAALQREVVLETGRFSVSVEDANARYDVNRLADRRIADVQAFSRIAAAAGLEGPAIARVVSGLARRGPLGEASELASLGLSEGEVALLAPHVTALAPPEGAVNLNAAGPLVLGALLGDARVAERIAGLRGERGFLVASDLARAGAAIPPGSGFTSDAWDVTAVSEVDGAVAELRSRLRRDARGDVPAVTVEWRRFGAAPGDRPPPPEGLD